MKKIIVEIRRETEVAKKILKAWQFKVFEKGQKIMFKKFITRLSDYNSKIDGDRYAKFEDIAQDAYIDAQYERLDKFLSGSERELHKEYKDSQHIINDRYIKKVRYRATKYKDNVTNFFLKKALGEMTVLGFFAGIGIMITYQKEKLYKDVD